MNRSRKSSPKRQFRALVDALEPRRLFAVSVANPIPNLRANPGAADATLSLANVFASSSINGTVVRFVTEAGGQQSVVDIELYDRTVGSRSSAPTTTANFLTYVNAGRYNNTIFHRALNFSNPTQPAQFLQGGGFVANTSGAATTLTTVQTNAPIALEFANSRPNSRGTIAMARTTDPNSATSGFFFNTLDNSSVFNAANPYAVFGRVLAPGLTVLDNYSALSRVTTAFSINGGNSSLAGVPVVATSANPVTAPNNLVYVRTASVLADADKVLSYSVTSDNNAIVTPSIDSQGRLVLDYGATAGVANITLTATDLDGKTATDTFIVNTTPELPVTLGVGGVRSVAFTDADGSVNTLSFSGPGSVSLVFTGQGIDSVTRGSRVSVSGTSVLRSLTFAGTTSATSLSATSSRGNKSFSAETVTSTTPLRLASLKALTVTDTLSLTGAVGSLTLGALDTATATLAPASARAAVALGTVTGSTVAFSAAAGNVSAASVTNSTLNTQSVGSFRVTGDVNGSTLTVTGAAGQVSAARLLSSRVQASTSVAAVSVSSRLADAFSGTTVVAPALGLLSLGNITAAGALSTIQAPSVVGLTLRDPQNKTFSARAIDAADATALRDALNARGIAATRLVYSAS